MEGNQTLSHIHHGKLLPSHKQDACQQGISAGVGEMFAMGRHI